MNDHTVSSQLSSSPRGRTCLDILLAEADVSVRPPDRDFTVLGTHTIGLDEDDCPSWPSDAIWVTYAIYRSHQDGRDLAWPSAAQLARESGLSQREVWRARRWLEDDGALQAVDPDEIRGPLRFYYPEADCRIRAGENILAYPACAGEPIITRAQLYFVNDFSRKGEACPVPNWLLRDPSIPPGEKRLGALIAGLAQRRAAFAAYNWYAKQLHVDIRTIARREHFLRTAGKLVVHGKTRSGTLLLSIPSEAPKRDANGAWDRR